MGWVVNLIAAGTGLFSVFVGLLYKYQSSLLYFPSRGEEHTPAAAHLHDYEDAHIKTKDGVELHGWLIKNKNHRDIPTLIMFHGNAGNLSNRLYNAQGIIHSLGCNLLMVSYRGYGKSQPVAPNEAGIKADAEAALEWAHKHDGIHSDKIVIFGRSLGGAVAIYLAHKFPSKVAAIIVENTFTSIPDMVDVVMPIFSRLKWLITNPWFSIDLIPDVSVPILFLSGAQDELVPPAQVKQLYDLASKTNPKCKLEVFPSGHHNDTWLDTTYYVKVGAWLAETFGHTAPTL